MLFAIEKKTQKQTIDFFIYIHCCLKILANNLFISTFYIANNFCFFQNHLVNTDSTLKIKKYCCVPLTFSDTMLRDDVNAFYQPYHCFQSFHHGQLLVEQYYLYDPVPSLESVQDLEPDSNHVLCHLVICHDLFPAQHVHHLNYCHCLILQTFHLLLPYLVPHPHQI